jgi:hypothetical protein
MLQLKEEAMLSAMSSSCDFNTAIEANRFEPIEALYFIYVSQSDSGLYKLKWISRRVWTRSDWRQRCRSNRKAFRWEIPRHLPSRVCSSSSIACINVMCFLIAH